MDFSAQTWADLGAELEQAHSRNMAMPRKQYEGVYRCAPGRETREMSDTVSLPLIANTEQELKSPSSTHSDKAFLDFSDGYSAKFSSYNDPTIRTALRCELEKRWDQGKITSMQSRFSTLLFKTFPVMDLVRLTNSGIEADIMAISTALVFTGRRKILILSESDHDVTATIASEAHSCKRSNDMLHEFVIGTYSDITGSRDLVESLSKDSLAAIVVEPSLYANDRFLDNEAFLGSLRQLATESGAVLIFHEVVDGRLHRDGSTALTEVTPDLIAVAKYLGGGFSLGAFGGKREIMSCTLRRFRGSNNHTHQPSNFHYERW